MNPLISVITPSFNSEKTIRETIESVLNQSYQNFEYILIDGASSDNTVKIANEYSVAFVEKNIKFSIISEPDTGIYNAMNKGINIAQGDIVGIINSDDFYNRDTLQKVAAFYEKTNFDVMYADLRIFDGKKEFIKKSKKTKKFKTRFWNHPTTFVADRVYNEVRYAEKNIYDDLNFMLECRAKGYNICILNEQLANFRLGGISTKKSFRKFKERLRIRNDIYKSNSCRGYKLDNFLTEFIKYILS